MRHGTLSRPDVRPDGDADSCHNAGQGSGKRRFLSHPRTAKAGAARIDRRLFDRGGHRTDRTRGGNMSTTTDIERLHTGPRMSKAVRHGGLVYLCGQTASGSASANGDIGAQTHEVLSRIDALLAEAGSGKTQLLSTTIYLRNI